ISGGALTGSAAADNEDDWSDIDLAFGVKSASDVSSVLADYSSYMYETHAVTHHVDVTAGAWVYRVFLLPNTLQVDLAFAPAAELRRCTRLRHVRRRDRASVPRRDGVGPRGDRTRRSCARAASASGDACARGELAALSQRQRTRMFSRWNASFASQNTTRSAA